MCYTLTNEVYVWSNDFKKSKILLLKDELRKCPRIVVYSAVNKYLYKTNTVDYFRLVKQLQGLVQVMLNNM